MPLVEIRNPEAFIRAETRLHRPPLVPEIELHLADEAVSLWQRTEEELGEIGLPPPFWAFAWAGGQALARYVLDHPAVVSGKTVLDFASGSGLVAIAAAKAGALHVIAVDIDPFAMAAIRLNSLENKVALDVLADNLIGKPIAADIILAGDICYQKDIAEPVMRWFEALQRTGKTVLIGDPGRSYLPQDRLESLAAYDVPVTRALEDKDIKRTGVWRLKTSGGEESRA
jgi:predicted nicotinamide N-methyase